MPPSVSDLKNRHKIGKRPKALGIVTNQKNLKSSQSGPKCFVSMGLKPELNFIAAHVKLDLHHLTHLQTSHPTRVQLGQSFVEPLSSKVSSKRTGMSLLHQGLLQLLQHHHPKPALPSRIHIISRAYRLFEKRACK